MHACMLACVFVSNMCLFRCWLANLLCFRLFQRGRVQKNKNKNKQTKKQTNKNWSSPNPLMAYSLYVRLLKSGMKSLSVHVTLYTCAPTANVRFNVSCTTPEPQTGAWLTSLTTMVMLVTSSAPALSRACKRIIVTLSLAVCTMRTGATTSRRRLKSRT